MKNIFYQNKKINFAIKFFTLLFTISPSTLIFCLSEKMERKIWAKKLVTLQTIVIEVLTKKKIKNCMQPPSFIITLNLFPHISSDFRYLNLHKLRPRITFTCIFLWYLKWFNCLYNVIILFFRKILSSFLSMMKLWNQFF